MGWVCKACWDFNDDNASSSCSKCKGPRESGGKASTASEGTIFKFEPASADGCPFKSTALQKLTGKYLLSYGSSKDVAGTGYSDVCPCQKNVNPDIVEAKVKLFGDNKDKTPSVPVFQNGTTGKLTILGDGHHTFCAALKSATPVLLYLFEAKAYDALGHRDWTSCTYAKFAANPAAKTGSKMT